MKNFNDYSPETQAKIISFARLLLSLIEIYENRQIPFSDFEKRGFSLEEIFLLGKKLSEILNGVIVGINSEDPFWEGPMNNRTRMKRYVSLRYKPEVCKELNLFLKEVENKTINSDKQKNNVELSLPKNVLWEKVMLKVKEGKQEIEIFYDGKLIKTTGYIELGWLHSKKEQKPDRQWEFLCALSVLSATKIQEANAENMRTMFDTNLTKENVHRIKADFVKRLQELFKTKENPFVDKLDYYQPIFTIIPEPILRQEEVWSPRLQKNYSQEPNDFVDDSGENLYEKNQDENIEE